MSHHPLFVKLYRDYGSEKIIKRLSSFLTKNRLERIDTVLEARIPSLEVAVEEPSDVYNALAIIRTAEAFGVLKMHLIASQIKKTRARRTTRGSVQWVDMQRYPDIRDFQSALGEVSLCGAVVQGGQPLSELDITKPLCLVFGNEQRGLSKEALAICDQQFTIPMGGMVESLNVSVAAGITLYDIVRRMKQSASIQKLSKEALLRNKAYYIVKSLGFELSQKLLKFETIRSSV